MKYLFLIYLNIFAATKLTTYECPKDTSNVIIFIDSCVTENAKYYTVLSEIQVCDRKEHSKYITDLYKIHGGKKDIWLFAFNYNINSKPIFIGDVFRSAIACGVAVVSFSGGGYGRHAYEEAYVTAFLKKGGTVYSAAGNDGISIDKKPFYPASYSGVIAVGGLSCKETKSKSNYGSKVKRWENGCYKGMFGSSFAVPIAVAKDEVNANNK